MTDGRKIKLSISLSAGLVEEIDRAAKRDGGTRSGVIEAWLRGAARRRAESELASDVIAYYESRTSEEKADDARLARSLSAAARRLDYGDRPATGRRRHASTPAPRKRRR